MVVFKMPLLIMCKRIFERSIIIVLVSAVPLLLITANVRWVVNFPLLYSYGFDRYSISEQTGIEHTELVSAGRQIREYFNNNNEFITVSVTRYGKRVPNLYNQREIFHMKDVKSLLQGVYNLQEITAIVFLLLALLLLIMQRNGYGTRMVCSLALGGGITLGLVVLVGLGSLLLFDRLFLLFHLVSFNNDLWMLDPSRDFLIAMFPQKFFFDATMLITAATIIEAVLLTMLAFLSKWMKHR